jgi:DNA-directed RNA polymerase subunit RPC12/RpoP
MDISFKCPNCNQELEVDASGAGSSIQCPACSNAITVPSAEGIAVVAAPAPGPTAEAPPHEEKHFSVPVHEHVDAELLIQKANRPLDVAAKESDKMMRIKTFKRSDCVEVGHDRFDEIVTAFLQRVGQANVISLSPINYSYQELSTRTVMVDYGLMVVYRG